MAKQDVLTPASEAELADAIREANTGLQIRGGGTRGVDAPPAPAALSTKGLSGIRLYEPGALTLVAGAGTPLAEVEAALAAEGQRLAFEPPDLRGLLGRTGDSTIGGVAAANASGPRRLQAGAARDAMLGVRLVDGGGTVIANGGRVMKNVTGYDLVKLMAGSMGTLGVLSEVSLKVLPRAEATAVVLIDGLGDADAVAAMSRALASPFDISGAAHTPSGLDGTPVTMIRVEGFADSVAYRAERLRTLLNGTGEITIEDRPERTRAGWAWVRDVEAFHGAPGAIWRVSVKPSDAPGLVTAWQAATDAKVLFDWGGGLIWLNCDVDFDPRAAMPGGHATRLRGRNAAIPAFHPEPAPVAAISAGLRARFDPRGILNPGLMG